MKAFSVIMHAIYAIAIVAALLFVVGGFVPEDLNGSPLDVSIGAESEYPASDPIEILEMNIGSSVDSYGNTATVYGKNGDYIATVNPNDDPSVTAAAIEVHAYSLLNPNATVVLKGSDGRVLTQEMIMKESNEITVRIYTEILITNNLRYDLLDVNVGVDQLSDAGTAKYRIVSSEPTTIATGEAASLPIDIEINTLNSALIMLIGDSGTLDINIGFEISGKYLYGLAGASIYATAKFSTGTNNPIDSIHIDDNRVEVTSNEKFDQIPIDGVSASIGAIEITITNNDIDGFSMVIDSGSGASILEVLEAQYAAENYIIEIDMGDPIELTAEQYAQLIDIVRQLMEGASP